MRSEPIRAELVNGIARPFALVVNGDSMAGELEPGDLILVDPDRPWSNGKIVVVQVEHEVTVKRIYREEGRVRLVPNNEAHKAIIVKEQDVRVLGVVMKAISARDIG